MTLNTYFNDFLVAIRPTASQREDATKKHTTLRTRLLADKTLGPAIVTTFLQGSYRRSTAIRANADTRQDVDVVVVTRLDRKEHSEPDRVIDLFVPFLREHYKDKWRRQGRAVGILLSDVNLDLVIAASPPFEEQGVMQEDYDKDTEVEEDTDPAAWKLSPLYIPDRDAEKWATAHPIAQHEWTRQKNRATDGHYVNVVKTIKWWHRHHPSTPSKPKGYPLEHLVGACSPDGIASVADGVTAVLETIAARYQGDAARRITPWLPNHGLPSENVFARIDPDDFANFHACVVQAALLARSALDEAAPEKSAKLWRDLLGDAFPAWEGGGGGFSPRTGPSTIGGGRFG